MFKPGDRIKWVNPFSWNRESLGKTEIVKRMLDYETVEIENGRRLVASQFVLTFDLKTLLKTYYEKDGKVL
jgi:hypothetical protein